MNIAFDRKILTGFISCSLVLLIVASISFRNSEKFLDTNRWVNHTHEVLYEFEQILLTSVTAESGVRGFIVSGNETFIETFNDSKKSLFEQIDRVREITRDNSLQQSNIEEMEKVALERFNFLEKCIEHGRNGNFDAAKALVASGEGSQLQDKLRNIVLKSKRVEELLLAEREKTSDQNASRFNSLFLAMLAAILVTLAFVYVLIVNNIRALRKAGAEATEKNWHLTGSSELIQHMQGNKSMNELGQSILNFLGTYVNVQVGSLYVKERNGQKLKLQSVYSFDKRRITSEPLQSEIAHQAASENKEILLRDIKPHTYDVSTTFGNIRPQTILATPLAIADRVVGVIELGSIDDFSERQRNYVRLVADSIAIAITSAQSREEVRELLEETQRQAEELEAQQNELRKANEELQSKTELLEESEGILKVQQEELQQANVELEEKANMLEQQKESLQDAKNEIEQKAHELGLSSRYKSEFLANMSHELRTPLNSILILSQLLSENKSKHLSEKETEHARNIYNSGSDLLNLINDILDLSKVEAGKMQLDIDDFTLTEIVLSLKSTFAEVAANKSVSFEIMCNDESVALTTDKQRLEQILKNLLSNAFKFTSKNGIVTLIIKNESSDMISFAVRDTGIGIPEGKRQVIFEAFQQADGSTKRKYGGTGLGLSISRELSTVLGGKIFLESEEGKGSTFTLFLPRRFDPASVASIEKKVELKSRTESKKEAKIISAEYDLDKPSIDDRDNILEGDRIILIIEDDEKFALTLLNFIRDRNYKGIITSQGTTGISYARHYRPDAILLDMKLPVMDGHEVLTRLKTDPDLRHIPVQIISGFDRQKESLALGAFDYLMKPVALLDLNKAFDKIEKFTSRKLKKLLIIEDNAQQNNAIRELIGNGDVKSFSAYSGNEAQEILGREQFDCIIVDLGLPDMSGFDLLEKIKADEKLKTIPIIVYTGKDLKRNETMRLQKLSDTVVLKTVNSHERLLDETILFLHRVESRLPKEKQLLIRKLHRSDEVLKGKVILLADDDIRNIYSLTNILEDEGLICITAENGRAALEALHSNERIDLVLMDIMMPEMDGYEAVVAIRKIEKFKKLPIIALTAKAMKGDKEKCLAVGMSDYISKPVHLDQLLSLLRVWLYK
jgi:CheY-like chemotaxis protein/CHASE3 domain sensor protein